jgi:ACS family pantothenate transporter-like MFS transporter
LEPRPVQAGAGPLILSWINEICSDDTEKRAIILAAANDFAYVVEAVVSHGPDLTTVRVPILTTY